MEFGRCFYHKLIKFDLSLNLVSLDINVTYLCSFYALHSVCSKFLAALHTCTCKSKGLNLNLFSDLEAFRFGLL